MTQAEIQLESALRDVMFDNPSLFTAGDTTQYVGLRQAQTTGGFQMLDAGEYNGKTSTLTVLKGNLDMNCILASGATAPIGVGPWRPVERETVITFEDSSSFTVHNVNETAVSLTMELRKDA
jgi:hypothetical protein